MEQVHLDDSLSGFPGSPLGTPVSPDIARLFATGKRGGLGLDGAAQDVVGDENRTRQRQTNQPPFRMICSIEIAFGDETPVPAATGWLVGRRTVVTAGHVLWWDQKVSRVRVIPGRDGANPNQPGFESTSFHLHPQWTGSTGQRPENDIAAIRLPVPIGEQIGWFGVAAIDQSQLDNHRINIAGYPRSVTNVAVDPCTELWFEVSTIAMVEAERLFYTLDTSPGQSGAPVMLWPNMLAANGPPMVVGVHARGFDGRGQFNSATRIDAGKLGLLGAWVASDNAAG